MTEINQTDATKPRLVGINHIALEVGDIDQALAFYGKKARRELANKGMAP
jgi:hypothetical protein